MSTRVAASEPGGGRMERMHLAWSLGGGRRLVLAGVAQGWLWLLAGLMALGLLLILYRYERRLVSRRLGLALLLLRTLAARRFWPFCSSRWPSAPGTSGCAGGSCSAWTCPRAWPRSIPAARPPRRGAEKDARPGRRRRPGHTLAARGRAAGARIPRAAAPSGRSGRGRARLRARRRRGHARQPGRLAGETRPGRGSSSARHRLDARARTGARRSRRPADAGRGALDRRPRQRPAAHRAHPRPAGRARRADLPRVDRLDGPPRDAAIAAVKAPEAVDKGQTARIDVTVKADGLPAGTEVPVMLERPGASPLRQTVARPGRRRPAGRHLPRPARRGRRTRARRGRRAGRGRHPPRQRSTDVQDRRQ